MRRPHCKVEGVEFYNYSGAHGPSYKSPLNKSTTPDSGGQSELCEHYPNLSAPIRYRGIYQDRDRIQTVQACPTGPDCEEAPRSCWRPVLSPLSRRINVGRFILTKL